MHYGKILKTVSTVFTSQPLLSQTQLSRRFPSYFNIQFRIILPPGPWSLKGPFYCRWHLPCPYLCIAFIALLMVSVFQYRNSCGFTLVSTTGTRVYYHFNVLGICGGSDICLCKSPLPSPLPVVMCLLILLR